MVLCITLRGHLQIGAEPILGSYFKIMKLFYNSGGIMLMTKKDLQDAATKLLRKNGFTWAGNKKTAEFLAQKKFEATCGLKKVCLGGSKKKAGIICPRIRRK